MCQVSEQVIALLLPKNSYKTQIRVTGFKQLSLAFDFWLHCPPKRGINPLVGLTFDLSTADNYVFNSDMRPPDTHWQRHLTTLSTAAIGIESIVTNRIYIFEGLKDIPR